jgi:hypothetical protein
MSLETILCATDPGDGEIDDQVALLALSKDPRVKRLICVFLNGKRSGGERREIFIQDYLQYLDTNTTNVELLTIDELNTQPALTVDQAMLIGPLNSDTLINVNVMDKFLFAGDFSTPKDAAPSYNLAGSEATLTYWENRGQLVTVPSALMADMRPTSAMMKWVPKGLAQEVYFTGFNLMGCRASTAINGIQYFAEGLVNPNVGRGANYKSVQALFGDLSKIAEQCYRVAPYYDLALKYFTDIYGPNLKGMKDQVGSIDCLARMNFAIEKIAPGIWTKRTEVYYSTFKDATFDGIKTLQVAFSEKFVPFVKEKAIGALNPLYDLYAAHVLLNGCELLSKEQFEALFEESMEEDEFLDAEPPVTAPLPPLPPPMLVRSMTVR